MQLTDQILLRDYTDADRNFIYNSWLSQLKLNKFPTRNGIPTKSSNLTHDIFFRIHRRIIETIFTRLHKSIIAVDKEDPDIIYGYLIKEYVDSIPVIHFIYVKEMFRKMGIMRIMLQDIDMNKVVYTHHTKHANWMLLKWPGLENDPYLV